MHNINKKLCKLTTLNVNVRVSLLSKKKKQLCKPRLNYYYFNKNSEVSRWSIILKH